MGLTSALNTSLNGLTLNETSIDVLGNNIANAGTNGFKASRVLFSTQLARTLSVGSKPNESNGGTIPRQIGLGATTAAIQTDFSQGSVTGSTSPSDLAIQGEGFFVMESNDGNVYTRNGNFSLNSESNLTNNQGLRLKGYGVDENFDLITTNLQDLSVPLGALQVAAGTRNITLGGALLPSGVKGSQGTLLESDPMVDGTNTAITGATLLTDTRLASDSATPLFTLGQVLSFTAEKGSRTLDTQSMTVTATSSIDDLRLFMDDSMGLQDVGGTTAIPVDADGIPVGTAVTAGGTIQIKGNRGTVNELTISDGAFKTPTGVIPIGFSTTSNANGESTVTSFAVYDSLGQQINVRMSAVLESQNSNSTTYRYFLESTDDSDTDISLGNGLVVFDSQGKVSSAPNSSFSIDRVASAAISPVTINMDLTKISGISSPAAGSTLSLTDQDGSAPGTLTNFVIDEQGVINGVFDNGIIRTLGQIVLARFTNPQGLLQSGFDTYKEGVASGLPIVAHPGAFGAGTIRAGAIELSNTDIGRNLVDLIVASTNYRGNARVISSVQQLVDELLVLGR